ncbi:MAG: response regulator [Bdellovibrionales bacterium]
MSPLKGKKIIVAEDDTLLRETLANYFKAQGAEVSVAENGAIAFEMVQQTAFDVVLTDIRMPGGDGLTLIKNIATKIEKKPLVFACSGFSDLDLKAEDVKRYNVVAIFEKPFNSREMLSIISNAVTKSESENKGAHKAS